MLINAIIMPSIYLIYKNPIIRKRKRLSYSRRNIVAILSTSQDLDDWPTFCTTMEGVALVCLSDFSKYFHMATIWTRTSPTNLRHSFSNSHDTYSITCEQLQSDRIRQRRATYASPQFDASHTDWPTSIKQ